MDEELITYEIIDKDIVGILNKKIGKLGELVYQQRFGLWCFLPIENFYYKPVHLALIIKKLNMLNDYHKKENEITGFSMKKVDNI
jgi:hypothetical protein